MTDNHDIANTDTMAALRKSVPAALKSLELAIQDGMRLSVHEINIQSYYMRQANTLDTVSRVLFAHCLANPAKMSSHTVRVALDAMNSSASILQSLVDLRWKSEMVQIDEYYDNLKPKEQTEGLNYDGLTK